MRTSFLIYAFLHILNNLPLGVDCATAFAADDLLQIGKDAGSSTAAIRNNLQRAQPGPIPDFKETSPEISSSNVPYDLYSRMASYKRPPTDEEIGKMSANSGEPIIPLYPREGEWKIKTWWMENVHPGGKRFLSKILGFVTAVFAAPTLLVKPLGPTIEKGFAKVGIPKIVPKKKGVWEILPEYDYKSALYKLAAPSFPERFLDFLMRKGRLGINWVKNQIGLGPKKVSLTLAQHFEQLMKHFQGKAEVKNLAESLEFRNKWKIPEYPPVLSADPFVKKAYRLGMEIEALKKSKSPLDSIKEDIVKLFDGNPVAKYPELEREKLEEFLTSDKHVQLLQRLHQQSNELMRQHQGMQKTLDLVVATLGGEKETKETFMEILESHEDIVNIKSNPKAKPTTEKNTAEEERVEDKDQRRHIKHAPFPSLESVLPGAYEFHLSPLLFLEEILGDSSEEIVGLKATRGYLDGLPRLEVIQSAAEKVEKYAEVTRHVEKLQKGVLDLKQYVFGLTRADFKDESPMSEIFKDLFEPENVWHTGMKPRKTKNDPAKNNAANSDAANHDAANHDATNNDATNNDAANRDAGPSNDLSRNVPAGNDPVNNGLPKDDPAKDDPAKDDPPKEDPRKNNPRKNNPRKNNPPKKNPPKEDTDSPGS
ncbi:hypothetical protein PCANC_05451 [Puccinia coronata f. sp. avenae]|uniref:Uncharacterized protein n=1 Tax=Puccinia coronata f. sp. avenae TaxID=200324 RepID=A0A2N5T6U1_9BASI|nr:hypothetical protein PCANC_05451 [Puccinia coronata f. sp. avenae]